MQKITLYMLRKTDNVGLLIPPSREAGSLRIIDVELDDTVYDKLLYFLFTAREIHRNQPIFLNGEVVGYAATGIPPGNPVVYAEAAPSSWSTLWDRAMALLSRRDYEEYPFQCINIKTTGIHTACFLPGAPRPVFIDREATRRIIGVDPVRAPLPLFIGNIVSTGSPMGLQGLKAYAPELIPYLAYLYRISGGGT